MRRVLRYIAILLVLGLIVCLGPLTPVQAASVSISQTSGIVGTNITVSGYGYTSGDIISITFGSTSVADFSVTGTSWTIDFIVPASTAGSHIITVNDNTTSEAITKYFTVTPNMTLSKSTATAGTSVTVTGNGFAGSDYNIQITFDSTTLQSSVYSDSTGHWSQSISIPTASAGSHTITAVDSSANQATANFIVQVNPTLTLNKASGPVGTSVTVSAIGFAANESGVRVIFGSNQVGSTPTVSSSGSWTMTFTIPPTPSGSYPVSASGLTTSAPSLSFVVSPTFSAGPTSGIAGTSVTASGSGFGANENVTLTFDSTNIGSTSADGNGSWTTTGTIPASSGGTHKISASGPSTPASSITAVNFTVGALISINPTSGTSGSSITVSGSSFMANESGISVTFDGKPVGSTTTANSMGTWSLTFSAPPSAGGPHTINAKGNTTAATSVPNMTFTIGPTVSLATTSGKVGDTITLSGTGFAANEKNITIAYDNTPISTGTTADDKGAWTASFVIPPSSSGSHPVKVTGSTTEAIAAGSVKISAVMMPIDPTTIYTVGLSITISGIGFAANSALKITYDDSPISNLGAVSTDASGNFNKSFKVPKSIAGPHTIKVADGQNNTGQQSFVIDSTPPSVPKLISPADGVTIGLFGGIIPTFQWSKSTGSSDLTYTLQITTEDDTDFENPKIEKTDITTTKYTLSKSEALPKGNYYWRVKAVDAASNQSTWSPSFFLTAGMISVMILVLLVILVIVIIALIIYFAVIRPMGKRRAQRAAGEALGAPEIVIPEVVNAEYRTMDSEDPNKRRALPWRLALPQAPQAAKGAKTLSPEDQARLKVIIDFAKSLPLEEPGYNTDWLIHLAENGTGTTASPALYAQVLKGEVQVRYEPAWMRHPTFLDLQTLLEGQPLLQDLNSFVDSVNHVASESVLLLQDIYKDTNAEITWDILASGGWGFISAVYVDSLSWFQGKNLREPSDRDYIIKPESPQDGSSIFGLYGEQNTIFAGLLIQTPEEKEAPQLRTLHLKLRRSYRNNDKASEVFNMLTQLDAQRTRLINAFAQFGRLNP